MMTMNQKADNFDDLFISFDTLHMTVRRTMCVKCDLTQTILIQTEYDTANPLQYGMSLVIHEIILLHFKTRFTYISHHFYHHELLTIRHFSSSIPG